MRRVVHTTILWIVGPPGVGKTSAVRRLLGSDVRQSLIPKPKWTVNSSDRVCAAGHYTGATFDGADTVAYNGVDEALRYWHEWLLSGMSLTIFDGDRFSNKGAVDKVIAYAPSARIVCVMVNAPQEVLDARRAMRGSKQNASWMQGRATKAVRFYDAFKDHLVIESASLEPGEVARQIKAFVAVE